LERRCAAWCFSDEDNAAADAAFDRLSADNAVVPALWWVEIRNIMIVGERRQRIISPPGTFLNPKPRRRRLQNHVSPNLKPRKRACVTETTKLGWCH
jgi:hypothetical protein